MRLRPGGAGPEQRSDRLEPVRRRTAPSTPGSILTCPVYEMTMTMTVATPDQPALASCPLAPSQECDWQEIGDFLDRSRRFGRITVERCRRCGHGRSMPPLADPACLYDGRESQDFQPNTRGLAHRVKDLAFARSARRLVRQLGARPGQVLDFGCGSGQLTRCLGDVLGPERVHGSDFFANPPAELVGRTYLSFDQLGDRLGRYDIVLASHVLEHDDNTAALLARIVTPCRTGGLVVIEVPNVDCFGARLFGKYWDGWYVPYHRVHFSRASLLAAVSAGGLDVVAVHRETVPTIGRTLANVFGRDNALFWLLLGIALHPLQVLGEVITGQPSAWRVIARKR